MFMTMNDPIVPIRGHIIWVMDEIKTFFVKPKHSMIVSDRPVVMRTFNKDLPSVEFIRPIAGWVAFFTIG